MYLYPTERSLGDGLIFGNAFEFRLSFILDWQYELYYSRNLTICSKIFFLYIYICLYQALINLFILNISTGKIVSQSSVHFRSQINYRQFGKYACTINPYHFKVLHKML